MNSSILPVGEPPAGKTSDFDAGMTSIQLKFIILASSTLAAASIMLVLRIWTRARIMRAFWLDDYAVIAAWIMSIGFFAGCLKWMEYGFGDHVWNVPANKNPNYAIMITPIFITYCWAPMLSKFSILLLLLKINPQRWFRLTSNCVIYFMLSYTVACTLVISAVCRPNDPTKLQCVNDLVLSQAVLNIASDFFVIILPIPMIRALQLPTAQKIALILLLATSSFALIASIVRFSITLELPGNKDINWTEAVVCIWSAIEINVGLMCNCLVVLKPFVRHYMGAMINVQGGHAITDGQTTPSGLRSTLSSQRWKKGSYQLESMDTRIAAGVVSDDVPKPAGVMVESTFEIIIEDAGKRKLRDQDSESQEEIIGHGFGFAK